MAGRRSVGSVNDLQVEQTDAKRLQLNPSNRTRKFSPQLHFDLSFHPSQVKLFLLFFIFPHMLCRLAGEMMKTSKDPTDRHQVKADRIKLGVIFSRKHSLYTSQLRETCQNDLESHQIRHFYSVCTGVDYLFWRFDLLQVHPIAIFKHTSPLPV